MMTNLKVFQNTEFGAVRTIELEGVPHFIGKDVAEILGYSRPDHAISNHVDVEDKLMYQIDTSGQNRQMLIINESGLYSLIISSKMPTAKKFKRWVTNEVLPSIRKHGMYATDELVGNPDLAIAVLTALKNEREEKAKLNETVAIQNQQILEMKPKASYYDLILQNKNTVPVTQIAKDYGMSGRALNKLLNELGVQYKLRQTWILYQDYANLGYTQSKTHIIDADKSVMHTYWTQKGRLFLYDLLKSKRGLLPTIERGVDNE